MKKLLILTVFNGCRLYLRHVPMRFGKKYLWDNICRPYLNWRNISVVATTEAGARMNSNVVDAIQQKLIYFGIWEPNLTAFLKRRLRQGDVFIDVGANIGYYSLLAAKLVGQTGSVLAIEASPSIFGMFGDNIQLNRNSNIRRVNCAVAAAHGTVTLYKAHKENIGASTISGERGYEAECEVSAAPLLSIVTPEEARRARVIKIDIEGAELPVLEEILRNVASFSPDVEVVSEISVHRDNRAQVERLFEGFSQQGFNAYELPNDYRAEAYFEPSAIQLPQRLDTLPDEQFDVIFSREKAASL